MRLFLFLFKVIFLILITANSYAQNRLVILGDSLTEGYGVAKEQSFPSLLEKKIKLNGGNWVVINAGVSGATSASGQSRLKWLTKSKVDLLIIALGANDGLRGLKIESTEKNLAETIQYAQSKKITVVLAGMLLPPNYGKDYSQNFEKMFVRLKNKYKIKLIPFLLDKVGGEIQLNQTDGIHPNEKGHMIICDTVYHHIKPLLKL